MLSVKRKPGTKDKHSYEPKPKKIAESEAPSSEKKDKKDKKDKKFKKSSASKRLKGT